MAKKNREVVMNAKSDPLLVAAAPQANSADLQQMMDSIERFKSRTTARKVKTDLQDPQDEQALSEGTTGEVVSDSGAPLQMAQASIPAAGAAASGAAASGAAAAGAAAASAFSPLLGGALAVGGLGLASGNSAQSDVDALADTLKAKADELQAKINELTADMDAQLGDKADADALSALKTRFDAARTELDALKVLANGTQADVEALQAQFEDTTAIFEEALDSLASELLAEIDALAADLSTDAAGLATLKGRFDTARTELDALKTLANGTKADLSDLSDALDQAKSDFQDALEALASDLRDEIDALAADLESDAADLATLKGRFDTAREELDALQTLADGTQADLETLQGDFDAANTAINGAIADIVARLDALEAPPLVEWKGPTLELTTSQIFEDGFDHTSVIAGSFITTVTDQTSSVDNLGSGEDNDAVTSSVKLANLAVGFKFDAGEDGVFEAGDKVSLSFNYGAGADSVKSFEYTLSQDMDVDALGQAVLDQMNQDGLFDSTDMSASYNSADDELVITSDTSFTGDTPVTLAELEAGLTVPAGEVYLSFSDSLGLLGEALTRYGDGSMDTTEADAFMADWLESHLVTSGEIEVPDATILALGEDTFLALTEGGRQGLTQIVEFTEDGDVPQEYLDLINAQNPLSLDLSASLLDQIEGYDPATVHAHVTNAMSVAQASALAEHGFDMANNVEFKIDDFFQNITSATNNPKQVQILQNALADKQDGDVDLSYPDSSPMFTFTGGADGQYDKGDVITLSWLGYDQDITSGDVVTLTLTVSDKEGMTGAEVATAFADMLAEDGGNFEATVSGETLLITGENTSWAYVKGIVEDGANIIARGTEVEDEMQFGAPELAGVPLTILAGAGDDKIAAGYGSDVIVGQQGADEIILTTRTRSGNYFDEKDTIVYETAFDGASYKEMTFGGFTASEDDYREGGLISVKINDSVVSYTITSDDVATFLTNDSSDDIDARDHVLGQLGQAIASADGLDIGEDQIDVIAGQGLIRIRSVEHGDGSQQEWLQASEAELRVSDQITVTFSSNDSDYYSDEHSDNFIQLVFTDDRGRDTAYKANMVTSGDNDDVTQLNHISESEVSFMFSADGEDDTFDKGDEITLSFRVASEDHVYTMTLSEDMSTDDLGLAFANMISGDDTLGEDIVASYDADTDTLVVTGDMPSSGTIFYYSAFDAIGEDTWSVNGGTTSYQMGMSEEFTLVMSDGIDGNFDTYLPLYVGTQGGDSWIYNTSSGDDTDTLGLAMSVDAAADLGSDYTVSYDADTNTLSITGLAAGGGSGLFTNVSGEDNATDISNAYTLGDAEATVAELQNQLSGIGGLGDKYIVHRDGTSITIQAIGDAYDFENNYLPFDFDVREHSITVAEDDTVLGVLYSGSEEFNLSADGLYSETTVHFTSDDNDYDLGSTIQLTTVGADGIAGNSDDLVFSYTITSEDRVGDFSLNAISKLVDVINSDDDSGFDASVSGDDVILTRNTFGTEIVDVVTSDTYIFASSLDLPYEATLAWTETGRTYAEGNTMTLSFTVFDTETGSNSDFTFSYDLTASDDSASAAVANFASYLTQGFSAESLDISVSVDVTDLNVLHITGPASGHPLLWTYEDNGIFNTSGAEVGDSVNITEGDGADNEGLTWYAQSADVVEEAGLPVTLHFDYDSVDVFEDAHIGVQIGSQDFDVALRITDLSSETVDWTGTLQDLVSLINAASLDITASLDIDLETLVLDGVQTFEDATAFATNRTSSITTVVVDRVDQDLNNVSDDGSDGGLTVLETASNSGHDVITGFQRDSDVIAFDGDLLARMGNQDDVNFTFVKDTYTSSVDIEVDLDMTGVVLVSRETNRASSEDVYVSDMTSADDVALLLNDIFDFSAETDGVLNTTVFNIVAADNKYISSLWVHTQAFDQDDTVDAEELTLLATVDSTTEDMLGMPAFTPAFNESHFAMSHLFPANQSYTVAPV